jgi:septum formation protein
MTTATPPFNLVLGSTSPFRRALLDKLQLPFTCSAPDVDESPLPGEQPEALVTRLSEAKALAVAAAHPDTLVIGSDQVACIDGEVLGKPGNRDNAIAQLQQASGKVVTFYTGLCLYNTASHHAQISCEVFRIHFRVLSLEQITRYVDAEQPFNCAGSIKSEGYGITLFERMEGDDPNILIGLPLIRLVQMLGNEGIALP